MCFDVSKGQTWDDFDWTDSFKESNVIHDTVTYDKFRIIGSESWNFLLSNLDTIYEENYYPLRIELLKDNSDSNIILKTPTIDFNIYHWYDGFKIKAGLGLNEVVLYIGEVIDCDTVWLDTMVYHVKDQRRFMTFSNFDSIYTALIRLGEQHVGYNDEIKKSTQFGLKSLRLAKPLEEGFVVTVEPGLYFNPALIDEWEANNQLGSFINYEKLKAYRNLTGIRVEEDFVITQNGSRLLGNPLAKTANEIEVLRLG